MIVSVFISFAAAAMLLGIFSGMIAPRFWLASTLGGTFAASLAAVFVGTGWQAHGTFPIGGEQIHLRLDGLSAFFLVLLCVVGGAGALYAHEYWPDRVHPRSAGAGRAWYSLLLLSLGLVL